VISAGKLPAPVNEDTANRWSRAPCRCLQGRSDLKTLELPAAPGGRRAPVRGRRHAAGAGLSRAGAGLAAAGRVAAGRQVRRAAPDVRAHLGPGDQPGRCTSSWGAPARWPGSPRWTSGQPVADALVRVSDCRGKPVADRPAPTPRASPVSTSVPSAAAQLLGRRRLSCRLPAGLFRQRAAPGSVACEDMAFTWSSWQRGIEPWRFNVPTSSEPQPDLRAHTVFDRTLLRAGETVSMKHLLRTETATGFGLPQRATRPRWSSPTWAAGRNTPSRSSGAAPPPAAAAPKAASPSRRRPSWASTR
jgi:hypothetical protein